MVRRVWWELISSFGRWGRPLLYSERRKTVIGPRTAIFLYQATSNLQSVNLGAPRPASLQGLLLQ